MMQTTMFYSSMGAHTQPQSPMWPQARAMPSPHAYTPQRLPAAVPYTPSSPPPRVGAVFGGSPSLDSPARPSSLGTLPAASDLASPQRVNNCVSGGHYGKCTITDCPCASYCYEAPHVKCAFCDHVPLAHERLQ
jgi:hypothetical protein